MADKDLFAPPTKEELKHADTFAAPSDEEKATLKKYLNTPQPSELESALGGAEQGLTLSHAPHISGAIGAALEKTMGNPDQKSLADLYNEYKMASQNKLNAQAQANPASFGAGSLGGGVLGLMGAGVAMGGPAALAEGAAAPTMAAKIGQGAALGGGLGAVNAQGQSPAPLLSKQMGKDILQGAGEGAVSGAALTPVISGAVGATGALGRGAGKLLKASWLGETPGAFKAGFGPEGQASQQWLLGPDAARRVSEGISNISTEIPQSIEESLGGAAKFKRAAVNDASDAGVKVDANKVDEFVSKFASNAPSENDPVANSELRRLQKIITNARNKNLSDPNEMLQLYTDLKNKTDYGDKSFQTPEAKRQVTAAVQDIQSMLKGTPEQPGAVPELQQFDKDIHNLNNAQESVGLDRNLSDPSQNKLIAGLVEKSVGTNVSAVEAQKQLNKMTDALGQVDPDYAAQIQKQIAFMQNQVKVTNAVQEKAYYPRPLSTPSAFFNKSANALGYSIGSITPDSMRSMGQVLSRTANTKAASDLANVLLQASGKDERTRNSLMFGLMQNPGYRRMLEPLVNDGEHDKSSESKDKSLGKYK